MSFNDVCVIKQHGDPFLVPTMAKLKLCDGTMMPVLDECNFCCECNGTQHQVNFKVIVGSHKPVLSGEAYNKLGLITINEVHQVTTPDSNNDALLQEYILKDWVACLGITIHKLIQKCPQYSMSHVGYQ